MRHLRPWICSIGLLALSGHAAAQEKAATQPAGPPVVSLLDAGAGPGRTLRLQTQVGAAQTLRLSIRMTVQQTLNQTPIPNRPQPSMNFTLDTVVTSVNANGDISYDFEITNVDVSNEPGVPPALADSIQRLLEPAVGVRGSGVTSDRGFSKQVRIPVPPGTSPILERQLIAIEEWLAQMTTPFPADPVGVGAKWQVRSTVTAEGITIKQTAVFTLVAVGPDRIEFQATIAQDADPQPVVAPGIPAGMSVSFSSYKSQGGGRRLIEVHRLFPLDATIDLANDSTMIMTVRGAPQQMERRLETSTKLKTAQPPAG